MSFTIGIGALIENEPFNELREVALRLAIMTNNWCGLSQPPHVTIKRPFEVKDLATIKKVARDMEYIATAQAPFKLKLAGRKSFGQAVIYVPVADNQTLDKLHAQLLERLAPYYQETDKFEGSKMVFHGTLAMDLSSKEYKIGMSELQSSELNTSFNIPVTTLGLFLGIDDLTQWVVIHQSPLLGKGTG